MDQTLRQLGELLLGSVPTIILMGLLYLLYTTIVHKPLGACLMSAAADGGAVENRSDIAARGAHLRIRIALARSPRHFIPRAGSPAGGARRAYRCHERSTHQGQQQVQGQSRHRERSRSGAGPLQAPSADPARKSYAAFYNRPE